MNPAAREPKSKTALVLSAIGAGLFLCSCRGNTLTAAVPPAAQVDRFVAAYPELRQGRFVILADFLDPGHRNLVQWRRGSVREAPRVVAPPLKGASANVHWFPVVSPGDGVVLSDASSRDAFMNRDWREYDLLMFTLIARESGRVARVELVGPATTSVHANAPATAFPLREGANLVRVDLADWRERVPARDVREIRIGIEGAGGSEVIGLADVVLTRDREKLLGDAEGATGSLFVERVGRRSRAGAAGVFELVWANGVIVEWYDLVSDPYRANNLVGRTGWGPAPTIPHDTVKPPADVRPVSTSGADCEWVELGVVRAVFECVGPTPTASAQSTIGARWVLHADGAVWVTMPPLAGTGAPLSSWTLSFPGLSASWQCGELAPSQKVRSTISTVMCETADRKLFVTSSPPLRVRVEGRGDHQDGSTFRLEPAAPSPAGEPRIQHVMLDFQPRRSGGPQESVAEPFFQDSPIVELEAGSSVVDESTSPNGFHPDEGGFVFRPQDSRLRFKLARRRATLPGFSVLVETGKKGECWVYLNQKLQDSVQRDGRGRLVFRIPPAPPDPGVIEVLLRTGSP